MNAWKRRKENKTALRSHNVTLKWSKVIFEERSKRKFKKVRRYGKKITKSKNQTFHKREGSWKWILNWLRWPPKCFVGPEINHCNTILTEFDLILAKLRYSWYSRLTSDENKNGNKIKKAKYTDFGRTKNKNKKENQMIWKRHWQRGKRRRAIYPERKRKKNERNNLRPLLILRYWNLDHDECWLIT